MPTKMKAWRIDSHGDSEVLKRVELDRPKPGPLEVLVNVKTLGLNHLDVWVRKGVPGHKFPLPLIPGCDAAGTIDEFGAGSEERLKSSGLVLGSPVLINPGISCGRCEACLGGFDPLCPEYGILGETRDGGAADFISVPVQNLVSIPKNVSLEEAAALPIPYLTAWNMVFRKTKVLPGEIVLIQAGGSGVSMAATQICKMIGATVITTVGDPEKAKKSKALGADHVILYKDAPFRDSLKNILKPLGKKGVDVVIDHVGSETFSESIKSLAWGGRLACCGATSGSEVKIDLKVLFFKNLALHGATMGSKSDLHTIIQLVSEGKLKPSIQEVLPMSDLPQGLKALENRSVFGKIVLQNS
jgi:NADPH:quinone reductase-like Zn-dependent oxidoreductase